MIPIIKIIFTIIRVVVVITIIINFSTTIIIIIIHVSNKDIFVTFSIEKVIKIFLIFQQPASEQF